MDTRVLHHGGANSILDLNLDVAEILNFYIMVWPLQAIVHECYILLRQVA